MRSLARRDLADVLQADGTGIHGPAAYSPVGRPVDPVGESGLWRESTLRESASAIRKDHALHQLFPAWAIGRDSRRSVILANHSSELATGFSRKCKQYVESPAWPFPRIEMSEDSRATHRWNVSPGGGGLFSVGIGSGLTGVGMDLGIVDDPINDGFRKSNANRRGLVSRSVLSAPECQCEASGRVCPTRSDRHTRPSR